MKTFITFLGALLPALFVSTAMAAPTVYVPLGVANEVIAIDAATDKITATYPGVENAHGLVATPDGEYLVAGSLKEMSAGDKDAGMSHLFLVHPEHGHVMSTIAVQGWSHHQAITHDGRYVMSTHPVAGSVSVVDLRMNKVVHVIKTGPTPNYTLVTRDDKRAYVSNAGDGTISEIDLDNWKVLRTLDGGPVPEHMVFSPDEKTIYVANVRGGDVSVVDVASGKVARTFHAGDTLHGLDIGDDGRTLFVTSKKDEKLIAIDTGTGKERTLALSPSPYHLNSIHGTGKVYVSSSKDSIIWVIDQNSLKVVDTIQLPGGHAHQMAVVQ